MVAIALTASESFACSPAFKPWWWNKKVNMSRDCSFVGGGRDDFLGGEPAQDLGAGRISQVVSDFGAETAVVSDCETGEQVQVNGFWREAESAACQSSTKVVRYLKPNGSLDLSLGASIKELSSEIVSLGYSVRQGVTFDDRRARPRDYPDFFCGCKLYYPDSPGAKL
ncbi:hypothetical protein [Ruegeria sp. A3M17]|uniref:hypothetical protein n=1 Tax=Ruegeria sp. A3M17 TaxID=2267229 RepID=UPI0011BF20B8|nr:hypothetical protein [Ruegeria sp. A3M17]